MCRVLKSAKSAKLAQQGIQDHRPFCTGDFLKPGAAEAEWEADDGIQDRHGCVQISPWADQRWIDRSNVIKPFHSTFSTSWS